MLSTQPPLNNPISTTYPISNLSTQLSHPKSSGYVSAQYNKQKIREPEQFFQTVPTPGTPLFSALFRYFIFPPVTSTRHTQHVIVRLFANISISAKKPYFVGFRQLFYLINFQLLIRLFFIISLILLLPLLNYSLVLQLFLLLFSLYYQLSSFAQFVVYLIRNHD